MNLSIRFFLYLASLGLVVSALASCTKQDEVPSANSLINETSPYLLQHAYNPVDWYPWGEDAMKKAQQQDKLLIISVGYAACHWCHVMEEESFSDSTVAEVMNQHYVSVKVDREERPDVDQVYMNAAQLANGRGGWPLNAIALPDGRPVFAGTYYPKKDWLRIIRQMGELYEQSPERLELVAEQLTKGIRSDDYPSHDQQTSDFDQQEIEQFFTNWQSEFDLERGGTRGAPKFPITSKQHLLMQYFFYTSNDTAFKAFTTTLDAMAMGGIYDQLGGGFSRYATDPDWKVPHFEKMLYDNAQLVSLYSDAYRMTGRLLYKNVVDQTLEFLLREMYNQEGGFYSSLNADSEGEEGKFYIWSASEIDEVLGEDSPEFKDFYNVQEEGNWEHGKNILYTRTTLEDIPASISESKRKLFKIRKNRIRPSLDDKVLTGWNALTLQAFVDAYRAFGEEKYLQQALKTANFLDQTMTKEDGLLLRSYKDGEARIPAFLDDYALLTRAYISLYQQNFDTYWLDRARLLTGYVMDHFQDQNNPLFFYTSDDQETLIARKKEFQDQVIPSSNAIMAENLYLLGHYDYREDYLERTSAMLKVVKEDMLNYPDAFSHWGLLMLKQVYPSYEVAILGAEYLNKRKSFDQYYLPNTLFLGGKDEANMPLLKNKLIEGKTFIYVCQDKICKLPVQQVEKALLQISPASSMNY